MERRGLSYGMGYRPATRSLKGGYMTSIFDVRCVLCGGLINTQKDGFQKQTDTYGNYQHWHYPICPPRANGYTILRLVGGSRRTFH